MHVCHPLPQQMNIHMPSTSLAVPPLMDISLPQNQEFRGLSLRPSPRDPSSRPLTLVLLVLSVPFTVGREEPLPQKKRRRQKKPNAQGYPICGIVPINLRHHEQWQHLLHQFQQQVSCIECSIVFRTIIERADHHVRQRNPTRDKEALAVR